MNNTASRMWELTGEITRNPLRRVELTVITTASISMARAQDVQDGIQPMPPEDVEVDARQHLGWLASKRNIEVPEGFISPN